MGVLIRLLIALGFIGLIVKLLSGGEVPTIGKSSNCEDEFLTFNKNLDIPQSKLNRLKKAREAIQNTIRKYFDSIRDLPIPKFALQGSFVSGTMIRTVDDVCDFDLGIYFFELPSFTYETIQNHIRKALTGHTSAGIALLSKCVRLNYMGDFHIDMPIYYSIDNKEFHLGSKGDNWELCDSRVFKDWVSDNTDESPQNIRLIRYFKAWSDNYHSKKKIKMPSGLVFTIWAIQFYESNERDDITFINTAAGILKYLKDNFKFTWTCEMPVEPHDNVLDKLSKQQQSNFRSALTELVEKGTEALVANEKSKSIKIWHKLLGKRFPSQ